MARYGLRDSIRFLVKPGEDANLETVVVLLLKDVLKVKVRQIICLQDFPSQGIYDVTFDSLGTCWNTFEQARELKESPIVKKFKVIPLFMEEEKVITVHLYNPFADVDLVRAFLDTYCDELRGGEKVMNRYGIWSGKYKFVGRFKRDPECVGGVRRPPAVFSIGGERGFLFYLGQPKYCRRCFPYGHTSSECEEGLKCRHCVSKEHQASQCKESRVCDICKQTGHFARQCDKYQNARDSSFAEVLSRGRWRKKAGGWAVEKEETRMEEEEEEEQVGVRRQEEKVESENVEGAATVVGDSGPNGTASIPPSEATIAIGATEGQVGEGSSPESRTTENEEMDTGVSVHQVMGEEPGMRPDGQGEGAHSPMSLSAILGEISNSEMEEEEEEEEEVDTEGESGRDLTCGQRVSKHSSEEDGKSSNKKARLEVKDPVDPGGGESVRRSPGEVCSPVPIRKLSSQSGSMDTRERIN